MITPLARALIAAMRAVDSEGRKVVLITPSSLSPADIIKAAQRTLDALSNPSPDPAIEACRLVNRKLCHRVLWEARAESKRSGGP